MTKLTVTMSQASVNIDPNEPPQDKTNKMACAPSEDSDQPGHPPSLIRVFAVHMKKAWVLSYPLSAQQSDWADALADPNLRWAHMPLCWFCHEAAQMMFGSRYLETVILTLMQIEHCQANLCLRAFRHDKV